MDKLLKQLENDFSDFACIVQGTTLQMTTNWRGGTEGVKEVGVFIEGMDPLTGEKYSKEITRFSAVIARINIPASDLHGRYLLRFEAHGDDGTCLGPFRDNYSIRINNMSRCPKVEYSVTPARGWLRLQITSNCWKRCSGHLWARAGGQMYSLHRENSEKDTVNFYFPRKEQNISLFVDDKDIEVRES